MLATRIDNFVGDNRAYAGYLLEVLAKDTLPKCILQLEKQVEKTRCSAHPPATQVVLEFGDPALKNSVWVKRTASFFENLPQTEDQWVSKRKRACLSNAADIIFTARSLATGQLTELPFTDHTTKLDLQDSLITFAQNVGNALVEEKGHSRSLVNDAQRELIRVSCGNCKAGSQQLGKDRAAVRWLLQEMQRQFRRGLQQRAFELFLISGKGVTFYGRCPRKGDQNMEFTKKFPRCDTPDEIHASLPFWIPFFVKFHVGDRWSYSTICNALGVNILNRDDDFRRFAETLKSEKLVACQLENFYATSNVQPVRSASTTPPHTVNTVNTNPQGRDGLTVPERPTKRQKTSQDAAGELQEASLHLLANEAVREQAWSESAVPSPGQNDVAAIIPRDLQRRSSPPDGSGIINGQGHLLNEDGRRAQLQTSSLTAGTLKDPLGLGGTAGTPGAVDPDTSDGVQVPREASSLDLLADAAGRGHEQQRSAEAALTLGPTEQILPHNSLAMLVDSEQSAGAGLPLIQSDHVHLDLGSYGDPRYFDFELDFLDLGSYGDPGYFNVELNPDAYGDPESDK